MRRFAVAAVALSVCGCATYRVADTRGAGVAWVSADPVISAGLPVRVILRKIDARQVDARYSSAELPAGRHEFLVDCRVAETGAASRHMVVAELESGMRYRLVGIASSRRCDSVELEQR